MTLGAGFHHYRVMFLDLEPGQRGEEGGEAGWVAGDARREKEAAGTIGELDCSLDPAHHPVGSQAGCLPLRGLSHQRKSLGAVLTGAPLWNTGNFLFISTAMAHCG